MNIIQWVLIIIFSVILLANEDNFEITTPVAYIFLGFILFYTTPQIITQTVKNNEFSVLVAFLGANGFGMLFALYSLYNRYEDIYTQPVVPAFWWTLIYIIIVILICSFTRKKK